MNVCNVTRLQTNVLLIHTGKFLAYSRLKPQMPPKRVAIVTSSTRCPRLNPTMTLYVYDVLRNDTMLPTLQGSADENTNSDSRKITLEILDLAAQSLPLYDETIIPAWLPSDDPTPHYTKEHARHWSSTVRQFDAFIFVTPQYNWSIPASLKNALDYLFHEWTGKPAGIVSYGSRGGVKAADHLKGVLHGLRMKVVETAPGLPIKHTGLPIGGAFDADEIVGINEQDLVGWREAGIEGLMRNLGMELVCELDKDP